MTGPVHPPAGGIGSYLVSFAAFDIGVLAYTAKPLVPVIELVFDSIAAPTDAVDVVPSKWVAEDIYLHDQIQLQYPASITSNSSLTDQPANGVTKKVQDTMSVSDSFGYTLGPPPPAGTWSASSDFTLTSSNSVATRNANGDASILATNSEPPTGTYDYTFSVTIGGYTAGNPVSVGVADPSHASGRLGIDAESCGVQETGDVWVGSFSVGGSVGRTLVNGDVIQVRIKNGHAYFNLNGGAWAGATNGADPAAGTGGVDLSGYATAVHPAFYCYNTGTAGTGAF